MNLQDLFDQESQRKPNTAYAPTQEHRERNRQLNKSRPGPNAGRTFSAEARANMAAAKLGKKRQPHTAETRAKMSASGGHPQTAEHKAKLSKPIMTPNGPFPSVKAVAETAGVSANTIRRWLKNFPNDYYFITKEV